MLNDEFIEDAIAKLELWITVLDLLAKRKLKKKTQKAVARAARAPQLFEFSCLISYSLRSLVNKCNSYKYNTSIVTIIKEYQGFQVFYTKYRSLDFRELNRHE